MTTLILIPNLTSQQPKINLNPVKGDVSDSELKVGGEGGDLTQPRKCFTTNYNIGKKIIIQIFSKVFDIVEKF